MSQRIAYAKQSPALFRKFVQFTTALNDAAIGWNRISIAFKTVPGSSDAAYGLDRAHLS